MTASPSGDVAANAGQWIDRGQMAYATTQIEHTLGAQQIIAEMRHVTDDVSPCLFDARQLVLEDATSVILRAEMAATAAMIKGALKAEKVSLKRSCKSLQCSLSLALHLKMLGLPLVCRYSSRCREYLRSKLS